jgi:hypothetical protein
MNDEFPVIIYRRRNRIRAYSETGRPIFDARGNEALAYIAMNPGAMIVSGGRWMDRMENENIKQMRLFDETGIATV